MNKLKIYLIYIPTAFMFLKVSEWLENSTYYIDLNGMLACMFIYMLISWRFDGKR